SLRKAGFAARHLRRRWARFGALHVTATRLRYRPRARREPPFGGRVAHRRRAGPLVLFPLRRREDRSLPARPAKPRGEEAPAARSFRVALGGRDSYTRRQSRPMSASRFFRYLAPNLVTGLGMLFGMIALAA